MLILLKPWTDPEDLITGFENFELAFEAFIFRNKKWTTLLDNMQLLHECHDARDDHFKEQSSIHPNIIDNSTKSNNNEYDTDDFEPNDPDTLFQDLLHHLQTIDDSRSIHLTQSQEMIQQCLQEVKLTQLFNHEANGNQQLTDDCGNLSTTIISAYEDNWKNEYELRCLAWKKNVIQEQDRISLHEDYHTNNPLENMIDFITNTTSVETSVKRLAPTFDHEKEKTKSHYNLNDTIMNFTLNTEQRKAFQMITEHSITSPTDQLRMFICGPGGTGKS